MQQAVRGEATCAPLEAAAAEWRKITSARGLEAGSERLISRSLGLERP
ncbi:MAG: hypothetical protein U0836_18155 [Pirellulales bacterium]